jgi:ppGpp synthetase/RelA/SpoT-type nucleotidyltranferase
MSDGRINELFCKENVEKIVVPDIVKVDLLSIIEEKLKKAGFYYRIAYRVKAVDSMVDKLIYKDYRRVGTENEDKKMQDLIGIRIMLYFTDDVDICRNLLDTLFAEPGEWVTTENNEYEFKAMKINGIFKLPSYLSKAIINPMLSDYVDDTFEVQVRTNSFEGWHEIEHDLRYKGSAFGIGNEALARKMNSILATLELCDDSIVKLLEDLGHQHYKDKKWSDMVRCHYRLKFDNEPIHPEIKKVLDSDINLAKIFFKFERHKAIRQLWNNTSDKGIDLTVTNMIRIVNQIGPNDERLKEYHR